MAHVKGSNQKRRLTATGLIVMGFAVGACGTKSDRTASTAVSTSAIASDANLSSGIVNANYSDALAASTSQGTTATALALSGPGQRTMDRDDDRSTVDRACVVDGQTAVVTISGAVEREQTMTSPNGRRSMTRSMKGSSSMKRTWSNTNGSAVACNSAGTAAQITWSNPANLKLEAEFERERERTMKITAANIEKEMSEKFKSSGKRTMTWGANDTSSDTATSYFRTHTASWESEREMSIKNDKGEEKEIKLKIATKEGAPVVVKVERLVSGNTVASRTFVSGTVIATKDETEGSIETSFDNLKISLADHECSLASGSATYTFKDNTGATIKTYTLSVDSNGDPQLKDSAGTAVSGFDLEGCDPEDLKL